jgi:hypothetical protein
MMYDHHRGDSGTESAIDADYALSEHEILIQDAMLAAGHSIEEIEAARTKKKHREDVQMFSLMEKQLGLGGAAFLSISIYISIYLSIPPPPLCCKCRLECVWRHRGGAGC